MRAMPPVVNPDAPPDKSGKYARAERERRFLLADAPSGPPVARHLIEDRYITGTRLRLRRMTNLEHPNEPGGLVRKLAQKVAAGPSSPVLITNLYLSQAEYEQLAVLPARELRKIRQSFPPYGVDMFEGSLRGLVLAEVEFDSDEEQATFQPRIDIVAEVTSDERFTGGRLVQTSSDVLARLLVEWGLGP